MIKVKIIIRDFLKSLIKLIVAVVLFLCGYYLEVELVYAFTRPLAIFGLMFGLFDLSVVCYDIVTVFLPREVYLYWNKFKILIMEELTGVTFLLAIVFIAIKAINEQDSIPDNLIFLVVLGLLLLVFLGYQLYTLIQLIRYILKAETTTLTGTLVKKSAHYRWMLHVCHIAQAKSSTPREITQITLPDSGYLKRDKLVIKGNRYDYQVIYLGSSIYHLIDVIKER